MEIGRPIVPASKEWRITIPRPRLVEESVTLVPITDEYVSDENLMTATTLIPEAVVEQTWESQKNCLSREEMLSEPMVLPAARVMCQKCVVRIECAKADYAIGAAVNEVRNGRTQAERLALYAEIKKLMEPITVGASTPETAI